MKSWHAESGGGIEGLVCKEHEQPVPGGREVLVKVRANSLNARELSVLRGTYPLPVKPDVVMCADGAGEVVELGPGVTRVAIGDRIAAAMFPRWLGGRIDWEYAPQLGGSLDGMLTDFIVLHEDALVRVPELRNNSIRRGINELRQVHNAVTSGPKLRYIGKATDVTPT